MGPWESLHQASRLCLYVSTDYVEGLVSERPVSLLLERYLCPSEALLNRVVVSVLFFPSPSQGSWFGLPGFRCHSLLTWRPRGPRAAPSVTFVPQGRTRGLLVYYCNHYLVTPRNCLTELRTASNKVPLRNPLVQQLSVEPPQFLGLIWMSHQS